MLLTFTLLLIAMFAVKGNFNSTYSVNTVDLSKKVDMQRTAQQVKLLEPLFKIEGDKAYGKPAFASSSYENGFASNATFGYHPGGWRSGGSTTTWFIVDLENTVEINKILNTLYVDTSAIKPPTTTYMASDDLIHWSLLKADFNSTNSEKRDLRSITISPPVKARYVGFIADDWNGGWADMTQFSIL